MPVNSQVGLAQSGKISWFGGPHDSQSGPTTSSGAPVSVPAISTYNQATKGGYWLVKMPNGRSAVLKQTDIGPAPWTGRNFDFTYTALPLLGYSEGNFPTDATITGTYLGKSVPAQYSHLVIGQGGQATSGSVGPAPSGGGGGGTISSSSQAQVFDASAFKHDLGLYTAAQAMGAKNPFDIPVKGSIQVTNPLGAYAAGGPPNPANYQSIQTLTKTAHNSLQQLAGGTNLNVHPGAQSNGSYVNPIKGFTLGQTDMGVDATAPVGTPIRALGDSQLTEVVPNWYAGQPLLLFKLLNGPKAGQYWYVSEQISPRVHQGQVVHAGETVATYAPSGTAIEIGWGSPTSNQRTLAGQYGDVANRHRPGGTPYGRDFRNYISGLP